MLGTLSLQYGIIFCFVKSLDEKMKFLFQFPQAAGRTMERMAIATIRAAAVPLP